MGQAAETEQSAVVLVVTGSSLRTTILSMMMTPLSWLGLGLGLRSRGRNGAVSGGAGGNRLELAHDDLVHGEYTFQLV
jgi:hypothetical protein